MDYNLSKLPNGLRVLTVPMPGLTSATVCVWVATGSRNEEKRINGISHFLEHMVFKGSKKRASAKEISQAVDSIGAEFNAATSKDWTNFYIKAHVDHLETAFDVLSDMVINPLLKEEEIEREKGTIIQEIAMYEDTPIMKIGDVFEEVAFAGNSLGWDTAGSPQSVKEIKRDDFVRYRKSHYYTDNMIVAVAGGVDVSTVRKIASRHFGGVRGMSTQHFRSGIGLFGSELFKSAQTKPQVNLKSKKSDQAHLIIGFLADGREYKNRYAQAVLAAILGAGMSSRLFIEVRERRGLAYSVKTSIERYQETGCIGTYVGTDPTKVGEAIKIILSEHYKIRDLKSKIRYSELRKAKEFLKGHLALALEDTKDVNSFFSKQILFLGKAKTPEETFKLIDKVSMADVYKEAARLFEPNKLNLAVIGPYKSKEKFIKLLVTKGKH